MKQFFLLSFFFFSVLINAQENYNLISQNLLQNIIDEKPYVKQLNLLEKSSLNDLTTQLKTDEQKIAFWVNVYNSYIQIVLTESPSLYEKKNTFFSQKRIKIAGELLSFNDIENGIIRKSKVLIGLGYIRKWFRPRWERKLRVNNVNWRIHFALNCGAKSCPPVAVYSVENLDYQLDFMTKNYLKEHTTYNKNTKTANSTVLMSWFRGDFGGIHGVKQILADNYITPEKPKKIKFNKYDWTVLLKNYRIIPPK